MYLRPPRTPSRTLTPWAPLLLTSLEIEITLCTADGQTVFEYSDQATTAVEGPATGASTVAAEVLATGAVAAAAVGAFFLRFFRIAGHDQRDSASSGTHRPKQRYARPGPSRGPAR